MVDQNMRGIPPVHRFLSEPRICAYEALLGKEHVKGRVTEMLDELRVILSLSKDDVPAFDALCTQVLQKLDRSAFDMLVPVINGTGILLHTNLGRAPLAASALDAMAQAGAGYSNLEYDLIEGRRGSRYARTTSLLQSATGAED